MKESHLRLSRLANHDRLCTELKASADTPVSRDWLIHQSKEILIGAKAAKNYSAAIAALREIAVLTGHGASFSVRDPGVLDLADRIHRAQTRAGDLGEFSREELQAMIRVASDKDRAP